jgi:hypothetical protein
MIPLPKRTPAPTPGAAVKGALNGSGKPGVAKKRQELVWYPSHSLPCRCISGMIRITNAINALILNAFLSQRLHHGDYCEITAHLMV